MSSTFETRLSLVESSHKKLADDHEQTKRRHRDRLHQIEKILNGNGEIGIVGQVKILWFTQRKAVNLSYTLVGSVGGALLTLAVSWLLG